MVSRGILRTRHVKGMFPRVSSETAPNKGFLVSLPSAHSILVLLGFLDKRLEQRPANEELWRKHLRHVFPGSPGTREAHHKAVADMRNLRNRCAHQDSLLDFDPGIELMKLLSSLNGSIRMRGHRSKVSKACPRLRANAL